MEPTYNTLDYILNGLIIVAGICTATYVTNKLFQRKNKKNSENNREKESPLEKDNEF